MSGIVGKADWFYLKSVVSLHGALKLSF